MTIQSISDFRAAIRSGPYTELGSYPIFFITSDGGALSFKAAKAERRSILESIRDKSNDGWRVVACDVNWEDASLCCDHTGDRIESAYAEDAAS